MVLCHSPGSRSVVSGQKQVRVHHVDFRCYHATNAEEHRACGLRPTTTLGFLVIVNDGGD